MSDIRAWILARTKAEDRGFKTPCWIWQLSIEDGYGRLRKEYDGRLFLRAHRLTYTVLAAPIPEGLVIDHLCFVRACCNPEHLEPVTPSENTMRSMSRILAGRIKARKPFCGYGHPMEGDNVVPDHRGSRRCRACLRRLDAERNVRRRKRAA